MGLRAALIRSVRHCGSRAHPPRWSYQAKESSLIFLTYDFRDLDPATATTLAVWIAVSLIALARIFAKAGEPWGIAFVPLYNVWVLARISGLSRWWLPLLLVPVLNLVILLYFAYDLAQVFRRSTLFAIFLLWILPPIGLSIIGFGGSRYVRPIRTRVATGRIDA